MSYRDLTSLRRTILLMSFIIQMDPRVTIVSGLRVALIHFASNLDLLFSLPVLLGNDHPALLDFLIIFLEKSQILAAF